MINDVKMIVCDIDGTLSPAKAPISLKTKKVLSKLHKKQILFGIASGRPLYQMRHVINAYELDFEPDFLIGMNGSQLYDNQTKSTYNYFVLKPAILKEIVDLLKPLASLGSFWIYKEDYMLHEREDEISIYARQRYGAKEKIFIANSVEELYNEENAKILFRLYDEKKMPLVEEYLSKDPSDKWINFKTQPDLIEFAHPLTNKGATLKTYCEMMNIDINKTVGFGDMDNDLPLIKACGMGVAMLNGSALMKQEATYVTEKTCVDDGLPLFIEKYILKEGMHHE